MQTKQQKSAVGGGGYIRNSVASAVGRILSVVVGVISTGLLSRAIGPTGFGQYSYILAYVGFFSLLIDFGFNQVAIREMSQHPEQSGAILGSLVRLKLVIGLVATVLANVLAWRSGVEPNLRGGIAIASIAMVAGAFASVSVLFQSRFRMEWNSAVMVAQGLGWLGSIAVLSRWTSAYLPYLVAYVLVSALAQAAPWAVVSRTGMVQTRWDSGIAWRLVKDALPLGIGGLLVTVYYKVDSLMLFNMQGPDSVAMYNAAYKILDQIQFLPAAVMASVYPLLSLYASRDEEKTRNLISSSFKYLVALALPIAVGGSVIAHDFIVTLYGTAFAAAEAPFRYLIWAVLFIFPGYLLGSTIAANRTHTLYITAAAIGAALNVGLNLVLIPRFGPQGAAGATLATEGVVLTINLFYLRRRFRFALPWGGWARTVGAVLVMALVLRLLTGSSLGVQIAAGGAVYLLAALLFQVVTISELRELRQPKGAVA